MKICLVCSAGGHFVQALKIADFLEKNGYEYFFITHKAEHIKDNEKKIFFITDPRRSLFKFFKTFFESYNIIKKERPDVIISTGAGTVIPSCYLGKFLFGSKIIHIDSFSRVDKPSLVGKLLYPIADIFLVQWENLVKKYGKKAVYGGSLL